MTETVLGNGALDAIRDRIDVPAYDRQGAPGVVHLGLGAFHRAHQARVFDALLRAGDDRWGVHAFSMRQPAVADALARQHGWYAVRMGSADGDRWVLGGAIWRTGVAATAPEEVHAAIAAPATRWVTITVTEKGYGETLNALLVEGLARRRMADLGGLTIASCDNLGHNGDRLRAQCLAAAQQRDAALADWIAQHVCFPNSMVDRIVPAASPELLQAAQAHLGVRDDAALGTEAFWEWVIEDRFADPGDAQALAAQGVRVVADVAPFEEAKLRMLNGSHTAMAAMGSVLGLPCISDCVADPDIRGFVHGLMSEELGPLLQRADWPDYRDQLLRRFANPTLRHRVHQIATDSSQKIPQRWPPSILPHLQQGRVPQRLAFAAAAWLRSLRGVDEAGQAYTIDDPLADTLRALALRHTGQPEALVKAMSAHDSVWGEELSRYPGWWAAVARALSDIERQGLIGALRALNLPSRKPS
ncbi:MAG: mannitol dehydrogenase family protein [Hydrogenophaga sp.]|nr:mannitol dehydrogenase family protein [Hydrogenophaga sp.]